MVRIRQSGSTLLFSKLHIKTWTLFENMNLFSFINPSKSRRSTAGMPVLPREEFRAIIRHECARCDRNSHEFSLILLDLDRFNGNGKRHSNQFIRNTIRRMRTTDEIGWFDHNRIGIFLPETSNEGAKSFIKEITKENSFKIYTYPSSLPFKSDRNKGNGKGTGSRKKGSDNTCEKRFNDDRSEPDTSSESDIKTYIHHNENTETLEELLLDARLAPWKRVIDIAGSLMGLIMLSPLFALISIYIKIVSPGPVFFRQERLGYLGRPFSMWKFRTMRVDSDTGIHQEHLKNLISGDIALTKLDQGKDERLIPLAGILRKTTIDELPQLINVLTGDMSLVGPRPCLSYEARDFALWQNQRFHAYPGMTGLWQVSGKNRTTFKEMMRFDIRYSQRNSFWMDLMIYIRTGPVIFGQVSSAILDKFVLVNGGRFPQTQSRWSSFVKQLFL